MRTLTRSKAVAALAAGLLVGGGGVAAADNLLSDGDDVVAFSDSNWAVGSVCAGSSASKTVPVRVSRQGSATSTNTYRNSSTVTVSGAGTAGGLTVSGGSQTITLPSTWEAAPPGTLSASASFQVGYTAPTAPGPFSGTVRFTGSGVNSSGASLSRTDDLTVSGTAVACDSTPPVIAPDVSGPLGDNGWHTGNVDVTWTVSDGESAITSSSGCGSVTVSTDTAGTTYTCSATSAGGTDSRSVTVKRDATAPVITPGDVDDTTWRSTSLSQSFTASDTTSGLADVADASFSLTASAESPDVSTATTDSRTVRDAAGNETTRTLSARIDLTAPSVSYTSAGGDVGSNGWYTSAVEAVFTAVDALSGPASQTDAVSSGTQEGSAVTLASPAFSDAAGNTAGAGSATRSFKVDLTDPDLPALSTFPTQAYATMVPPAPSCSSSDAVSGLAGCTVTGYSTAVGSHTLIATATDNAGRTRTSTLAYTVSPWTLRGLYSPVDMGTSVWNTVKGGNTVPLKFEVFTGSTELTTTTAIGASFTAKAITCPSGSVTTDEIEILSTGSTILRFDTSTGQFIQNWATPKKPGSCYAVTVATADGSKQTANFILK